MRGEGKKSGILRKVILEELAAYKGPMSSRQLFYRCVSRGVVQNDKRGCAAVLRRVLIMRRDGSIDYTRIVDRNRRKHHLRGWDSLQDIIESTGQQYRRDLWIDQEVVPMIACEKAALEGIFAKIVDQYGASLWILRGFASESFAWEWAEEIKGLVEEGHKVEITYFGDYDPSGLAIGDDARDKLAGFGAEFTWQRAGLLREDLEKFSLVAVPVKKTDSRAKAFLSRFGDRGAELDALHPAELERRIRDSIVNHLDVETWNAGRTIEKRERESLALVVKNWDVALRAVGGAP